MTTKTDDFNRANEVPIGGNWENITANGLAIVSNRVQGTSGLCVSAWKASSFAFAGDQSSSIQIFTPGNSDDAGVGVRLASTGGGRGYVAQYRSGDGRVYLSVLTAGALTTLIAPLVTWATGDTLTISAVGTTIEIFQNGISRGSVTNSTYTSGGQPGLVYQFDNVNATKLDNWQGQDSSSSGYTLTAAQGSYGLTGQVMVTSLGRVLTVGQGSYTLLGSEAYRDMGMAALPGGYSLTGQDAALTRTAAAARSLVADPGSYTLTGQTASTVTSRKLTAEQAGYLLVGQNVVLLGKGVPDSSGQRQLVMTTRFFGFRLSR